MHSSLPALVHIAPTRHPNPCAPTASPLTLSLSLFVALSLSLSLSPLRIQFGYASTELKKGETISYTTKVTGEGKNVSSTSKVIVEKRKPKLN